MALNPESPYRMHIPKTSMNDEVELNQGSMMAGNGKNSQRSLALSSNFMSMPQSMARGTLVTDTSSTSRFSPGHSMHANAVLPAGRFHCTQDSNAGHEKLQTGGIPSEGISQAQLNTFIKANDQGALAEFVGNTSSVHNYPGSSNVNVAAQSVQNSHLVECSTEMGKDYAGSYATLNENLNKKIGNIMNTVDFRGMSIAAGTSVSDKSNLMVRNEKQCPQMPSTSAHDVSTGGHVECKVQRIPMGITRNLNHQRYKEHLSQNPNIQYICNNQNNPYRISRCDSHVTELMSNTSSRNIKGEGHGFFQSSGSSDPSETNIPEKELHQPKSLNLLTSESNPVENNSRNPPFRVHSSTTGLMPSHPSNFEDPWKSQTSSGPGYNTRAGRCPESDSSCLPENIELSKRSRHCSLKPVHGNKCPRDEHPPSFWKLSTDDKAITSVAFEQHSASVSDRKPCNVEQPVDAFADSHLTKDSCIIHQVSSYPMASSHQSSSIWLNSIPVQSPGRQATTLQQSSNKENQVIPMNNQLDFNSDASILREDGLKHFVKAPAVMPKGKNISKARISGEDGPPNKKRKKQLPLRIPWHVAIAQSNINLPSSSDGEVIWARSLNRLPEKDCNATYEDKTSSIFRAKRRLSLTTQFMQQLFPPLPDGLLGRKTLTDTECGIFSLAKLELEDACRIVVKANGQTLSREGCPAITNMLSEDEACHPSVNTVLTKCVENFMNKVKHLEMEIARLDCSTSTVELCNEIHEVEQLAIVNRLAKHHGIEFTMDSSDNLFIENNFETGFGGRKPPPQRYVTVTPMPRTLPMEGRRCLSL
ncbi:hypothetical protein KP509_13G035700 [Ceratopteris richardii]|nr:hypothetical protein KP509_13G035700 [Ceratopteris richardii]